MADNTVKIKGKEFKVRNTLRALFIFEQITGKPFQIETLLDNYLFYYSTIAASNPDTVLEWDTFIDAVDEDPDIPVKIAEILKRHGSMEELLAGDEKEGEEGSKKKRVRRKSTPPSS